MRTSLLIQYSYFSGFKNKDVAFFHPASKTMLAADLLFNLPAREQVRHCFPVYTILAY